MLSAFAISQILAGIACITDLLSFQFKSRTKILAAICCSSVLLSIHFFLLGKLTACVLVFLAAVRSLTAAKTTDSRVLFLFLALSLASTYSTYDDYISLIAGVASVNQTIGTFQKTDRNLRRILMVGSSIWILHNILVRTPVAIFLESLFLASNFVGYYRFYGRGPAVSDEDKTT